MATRKNCRAIQDLDYCTHLLEHVKQTCLTIRCSCGWSGPRVLVKWRYFKSETGQAKILLSVTGLQMFTIG